MSQEWLFLFAGATALSAIGFVGVAVLWLRKLRDTLASTLGDASSNQARSTQSLAEGLAKVQQQQDVYNQQIQTLAQAGLRLQHELSAVNSRLNSAQENADHEGQTLH